MTILNSKRKTREPVGLPITLESAKVFLKISNNIEDNLIKDLIKSTANTFEIYTGIALLNQEWHVSYRQFSTLNLSLPVKPVQEILSIKLYDINGNFSAYNRNYYTHEANELTFSIFPCSYLVKIDFKAGFGESEAAIPEDIKSVLINHVAYQYENRGSSRNQNTKIFEQFRGIKL